MNILDIIFPRYCVNCKKYGDFLCPDCFSRVSFDTKNICLVCGKPSYDGLTHPGCSRKYAVEGTFTGVVYSKISKKLIYQFKYKPHLTGLSGFLGDLLYESLIQNEEFEKKILRFTQNDIIMVPIPLNSSKMRKRGYNQSEILAKEIAKRLGFVCKDALERVKDTKSQFELNKEERKKNIEDAFALKSKYKDEIKGKTIILVDDVLTTGATISEAAKIIKKSGVKTVWGLAFAREQ